MTREQALNYLYNSGFSEGQVNAVVEALTDEDAISRSEAIDQMEQAYNILDATDRIKALPSVQAVCGDAISREEATAEFIKWQNEVVYAFGRDYLGVRIIQSAIDTIRQLHSVHPSRRKGHWIKDEFGTRCDCCGKYAYRDKFDRPWESPFCPICGAKMESWDKG